MYFLRFPVLVGRWKSGRPPKHVRGLQENAGKVEWGLAFVFFLPRTQETTGV